MYMLRGLVKEHFLEVCFEQDFKRRYRYALVKKKGSEKKRSETYKLCFAELYKKKGEWMPTTKKCALQDG